MICLASYQAMFMVSCIVLGLTKPRYIKVESGSAPQFFDAETPPKSTRKLTHPVVPTWRFMGVIGRVAIHVTYYNPYWGTYNQFITTHEPLCRALNNSEYGFRESYTRHITGTLCYHSRSLWSFRQFGNGIQNPKPCDPSCKGLK